MSSARSVMPKPEDGPTLRSGTRAETLKAELEAMIIAGELAPGMRLDESELAARFQVSRTPVREAIKSLMAVGLVQSTGRQGVAVAKPQISALLEMFELMATLEGMCASYAARRASPSEKAQLRADHARLVLAHGAGDPEHFYEVNRQFHDTLYAASHTSFIAEQSITLQRRLAPYRLRVTHKPERMAETIHEQEKVIDAIERGDAKRAAEAAASHVRLLGDDLSDVIALVHEV